MVIGKFLVLAGLVTALAVACVAQDEAKTAAQAELNSGVKAYKTANYEEAIDHFNKAVSLDPEFMLARQYLATSYSQQFSPGVDTPENVVWATNALEQYAEILQRNPSDIHSIKGIAFLKLQLKDFDQAKENYKKAVVLDPSDPSPFIPSALSTGPWRPATLRRKRQSWTRSQKTRCFCRRRARMPEQRRWPT